MRRTLTICIILMAVLCGGQAHARFESPWVRSIKMPEKSQRIVEDKMFRYSRRAGYDEAMRRMAHLKPAVDDYCRREGIDPEPIYGLILTESQARPDAVDGVFRSGRSSKAHIGLGQLNYQRLPKHQRFNPSRIKLARNYQWTDSEVTKSRWKPLDKRFDPKWNLRTTIHEFHGHINRTGDATLALMGHHGGGNDPVRAVYFYGRDHWVSNLKAKHVPAYVRKHNLNYFVLYEERGMAYSYWANKNDYHVTYAFAPVVWSELFARWCKWHNVPVGASKPKVVQAKATFKVAKLKNGGTSEMNTVITVLEKVIATCAHLMNPNFLHHSGHQVKIHFSPFAVGLVGLTAGLVLYSLCGLIIWRIMRFIFPPVWKAAAKRYRIVKIVDGVFIFSYGAYKKTASILSGIWYNKPKSNSGRNKSNKKPIGIIPEMAE